jgi:hypothetical protein
MLKTRAERRGDKWIVNGQKIWTSRALHSDLMLLLVRTTPIEQCQKRSQGLSVGQPAAGGAEPCRVCARQWQQPAQPAKPARGGSVATGATGDFAF